MRADARKSCPNIRTKYKKILSQYVDIVTVNAIPICGKSKRKCYPNLGTNPKVMLSMCGQSTKKCCSN
jgi:hypothetical protein